MRCARRSVLAGTTLILGLGLGRSSAADGVAHCDKTSAECAHKVCKVVPDVKRVTHAVYSSKEEWHCLPKCPCPLPVVKKDCSGSACPTCEKPRLRRVLVKRLVADEKPGSKCVIDAQSPHCDQLAAPAGPKSRG